MPKISDLTEVTSPSAADVLPVVSGGTTKKATITTLGGASGTAELDFGAFPGASDASVAVTGEAAIPADAVVSAWILPAATADHTADEHWLESLMVFAGNVSAGVGFTIYGVNASQLFEPIGRHTHDNAGGRGTRIYGKWNIGWNWRHDR